MRIETSSCYAIADSDIGYSLEESFTVWGRAHWLFTKAHGNRQFHTICLMEFFDEIAGEEASKKCNEGSQCLIEI